MHIYTPFVGWASTVVSCVISLLVSLLFVGFFGLWERPDTYKSINSSTEYLHFFHRQDEERESLLGKKKIKENGATNTSSELLKEDSIGGLHIRTAAIKRIVNANVNDAYHDLDQCDQPITYHKPCAPCPSPPRILPLAHLSAGTNGLFSFDKGKEKDISEEIESEKLAKQDLARSSQERNGADDSEGSDTDEEMRCLAKKRRGTPPIEGEFDGVGENGWRKEKSEFKKGHIQDSGIAEIGSLEDGEQRVSEKESAKRKPENKQHKAKIEETPLEQAILNRQDNGKEDKREESGKTNIESKPEERAAGDQSIFAQEEERDKPTEKADKVEEAGEEIKSSGGNRLRAFATMRRVNYKQYASQKKSATMPELSTQQTQQAKQPSESSLLDNNNNGQSVPKISSPSHGSRVQMHLPTPEAVLGPSRIRTPNRPLRGNYQIN